MIVYDVRCGQGHRFEGWFADSSAFVQQRDRALIACPYCGDTTVERAPSVPRLQAKGNAAEGAPSQALVQLAKLQRAMLKDSQWVGDAFADRARSMADGTEPQATIHGQATLGQAKALHEEGIKVTPLPFPVVPPESRN